MTYKGKIITYTKDGAYRPNEILVDGVSYTMEAYAAEHGYNWKALPGGNKLFYRAADGSEFAIEQAILQNTFRGELHEAYKATGLSQRALAEAIGVPRRTLEDWLTGRRTPTKLTQEAALAKIRSL